jgi:adenine-specific DNA-methyltransferase
MELTYPEKVSEAEILAKAGNATGIDITVGDSTFIKGDNFAVMASLLASGFAGKIDLVYIDPPFNTNQVFTVDDDRVSTISRSRSNQAAYSDNMTRPEYLEFMRERLILLRELLSEKGSIYVHIDCKVGHYLKIVMDEVFGADNFVNDICRIKSNPKNFKRRAYGNQKDVIYFYAKDRKCNIFNDVTIHLNDDDKKRMFDKVDETGRRYNTVPVHAPGETQNGKTGGTWRDMFPPKGRHWRTDPDELERLDAQGLIEWSQNGVPRMKKYADDHKGMKVQDVWYYLDPAYPEYPTEKNKDMIRMIIEQSSECDSYVMDCFAGSGTTLRASEESGRRWIGIDKSDFSAELIRDWIMDKEAIYYDFESGSKQKYPAYSNVEYEVAEYQTLYV